MVHKNTNWKTKFNGNFKEIWKKRSLTYTQTNIIIIVIIIIDNGGWVTILLGSKTSPIFPTIVATEHKSRSCARIGGQFLTFAHFGFYQHFVFLCIVTQSNVHIATVKSCRPLYHFLLPVQELEYYTTSLVDKKEAKMEKAVLKKNKQKNPPNWSN